MYKNTLINMHSFLFFFLLFFSANTFSNNKEVMCELDGTLSITYRDLTKNVVSESLDFFKNLATQTQQSIFLINKAKTNFDQDDWERSSLEVVQYWELQDEDLFRKLNYTFDPSPIWINPKATWEQKKTETGFEIISAMQQGDEHPLFDNYTIEYYRISNSLNWFTGKGRIHGDIWLKSKEGGRNKNPKVEIRAKGSCNPKARKF